MSNRRRVAERRWRQQQKKEQAEYQREHRPIVRVREVIAGTIHRHHTKKLKQRPTHVAYRQLWGDRAVDALSRAVRALDEALRYGTR